MPEMAGEACRIVRRAALGARLCRIRGPQCGNLLLKRIKSGSGPRLAAIRQILDRRGKSLEPIFGLCECAANQGEKPVTSVINRIVMALARGVLLVGATTAAPAFAQESPPPANVNDCTFLRDPIKVRLCIESFQGSVQSPDIMSQPPTPPVPTPPIAAPAGPAEPPPQAPPPRLAPQ